MAADVRTITAVQKQKANSDKAHSDSGMLLETELNMTTFRERDTEDHRVIGSNHERKIVHNDPVEMVLDIAIGRRLLNVREAAQYLGLEVDTVYKKARLREVPCVKVGRALRFDVKALERFVEQHSIETID